METLPNHSGLYKIVKEEHNVEALKTVWHYVNMTLALIATCIPVFFTCKTLYDFAPFQSIHYKLLATGMLQ